MKTVLIGDEIVVLPLDADLLVCVNCQRLMHRFCKYNVI